MKKIWINGMFFAFKKKCILQSPSLVQLSTEVMRNIID